MRPICHDCLKSNPRLARYDPCLACLGGVGAINAGNTNSKQPRQQNVNVSGAVRDEDNFIVGDEEDDSEDEQTRDPVLRSSSPPPSYDTSPTVWSEDELESSAPTPGAVYPIQGSQTGVTRGSSAILQAETSTPTKYYIKPGDSLQGIALRFGVNASSVCLYDLSCSY